MSTENNANANANANAGDLHARFVAIVEENAKLRDENKRRRKQVEKYKQSQPDLSSELEALRAENARLKAVESSKPEDLLNKIAELEGQILTSKHKDLFTRAAKAAGVREDAIDDAWTLSGYKAEGEPDESSIGEVLTSLKGAKAFLFAGETQQSAPEAKKAAAPLKVAVDTSRGTPDGGSRPFRVSKADTAKPGWFAAHGEEFTKANREGRVVWTD